MNGWLIFGGIVLLLILLFAQSVTVTATYEEKLDVKVKFLFFTIYPTKPKKKRSPKKRKKNAVMRKAEARETDGERELPDAFPEEAEAPPGENAEAPKDAGGRGRSAKKMNKKEKKKGLGLTFAEIMEYVRSASPPLKRLFKKIRCRDLTVDYTVATDDAAKTAIKYGAVCAAVYPVIEWLTTYFSVRVRRVHVEADFSKKEDLVYAYCKIKLRVSTALGCILWLGVRVVKTYFKIKNPKEVQA